MSKTASRVSASSEDERQLGNAFDVRLVRRLAGYVRPYLRLGLGALVATALVAGAQSLTPYLLGRAVDDGIVRGDATLLWKLGGLVIAVELAAFAIGFAQLWLLQLLGQHIMVDLRTALMDKLSRSSMSFFAQQPVGRLVTRVSNDVGTIAELFSTGLVTVVGDVLAIALAAGFMLWLDVRLSLVAFAVIIPIAVATWSLKKRIRKAFRAMRRLLARLNAFVAETISGIRVVHGLSSEVPNLRRFLAINDQHLEAALSTVHWNALYASTITALTGASVAALLFVGARFALSDTLQVGVLVAVISYAHRLYMPIRDIAEKYTLFQSAMAGAERVFQVLDAEIEVLDPPEPRPLPCPLAGEIRFENVTFRYPTTRTNASFEKRDAALRDVSFRVAPGERIGIVGHTGAGKSTIIHLIGRYYDVSSGCVRIDGLDVREVAQDELRKQIGIVHQDVFIFSGTVYDNLTLGNEAIDRERAQRAARAVGADEWIRRLPQGYDTVLPERGATLSVGQKQLLSFARTLAHDPRVLVLDEATASIDPETEAKLQSAIERLTHGRTSIIIAHRLATLRNVDRLLVLHQGRLKEQGTWDELLARRGLFYTLHRLHFSNSPAPHTRR